MEANLLATVAVTLISSALLWAAMMSIGPLLVTRFARTSWRGQQRDGDAGDTAPKVTVLVAARDEDAAIGERIDNLLGLEDPGGGIEILVVSDGSTDQTATIVGQRAENAPADRSIKLVELAVNQGKDRAIAAGVEVATGEIIALSDATTHWQSDVLVHIVDALCRPGVGAASGRVLYRGRDEQVARGFSVYQRMVVAQRSSGRASGLQASTSGACSAIWRRCFATFDPDLNSDLQLVLMAAESGLGTAYVAEAICWEEPRTSLAVERAARVRIALLCLQAMAPMLRRLFAISAWSLLALMTVSKLLRWFVWVPALAYLVGLSLLCFSGSSTLSMVALAAVVATLLAAMLGRWSIGDRFVALGGVFNAIGYVVLSIEVTFVGFVRFCRRESALQWRPDRS